MIISLGWLLADPALSGLQERAAARVHFIRHLVAGEPAKRI